VLRMLNWSFGFAIREVFAMFTPDQELLSAFDGHDVEGVRAALDEGADPCSPILQHQTPPRSRGPDSSTAG
jgi:hypothetical protein